MQLDLPVIGALLLLVLPPLGVVCVLLTGPIARAIGRYQHEEEQVTRAPVFVAGIALLLEASLAVLLRPPAHSHSAPRLEFGTLTMAADTYTLAGVVGLSVVAFLALVCADLSRAVLGELRTVEVGALLFVWAANVVLAAAATLRAASFGVSLALLSVSAVLLTEAWKHPRRGRIWLVAWAVLVPVIGWVLLGPSRQLGISTGFEADRGCVSRAEPTLVRRSLAGLWLAGGLLGGLGPVLVAALPRRPRSPFPGPALLCAIGLVGALPTLFRATTRIFPAGPYPHPVYRYAWLSPRMAALTVVVGVGALAIARLRLSPFRRLCLVGFGCVCAAVWAMMDLSRFGAEAVLMQTSSGGVLLAVAFAGVAATEHSHRGVQPTRLPGSSGTTLPILASIPWAWLPAVAAGKSALYVLPGALLAVMLLMAAVRLSGQVRELVDPAARRPPGSLPAAQGPGAAALREVAVVAASVAASLVVAAGFLWPDGVPWLGPPIP